MDTSDERVNTSDAEELETVQANAGGYWDTHLPSIRTAYSFLDHLDEHPTPLPITPNRPSFRTSEHAGDDSPRPWKRLKVCGHKQVSQVVVLLESPGGRDTIVFHDT